MESVPAPAMDEIDSESSTEVSSNDDSIASRRGKWVPESICKNSTLRFIDRIEGKLNKMITTAIDNVIKVKKFRRAKLKLKGKKKGKGKNRFKQIMGWAGKVKDVVDTVEDVVDIYDTLTYNPSDETRRLSDGTNSEYLKTLTKLIEPLVDLVIYDLADEEINVNNKPEWLRKLEILTFIAQEVVEGVDKKSTSSRRSKIENPEEESKTPTTTLSPNENEPSTTESSAEKTSDKAATTEIPEKTEEVPKVSIKVPSRVLLPPKFDNETAKRRSWNKQDSDSSSDEPW